MKIVSLLPSATEMICAIGLRDQLCGVTHECDFPIDVLSLPKVTSSSIPPDATSQEIDQLVSQRGAGPVALYSLDMEVLRQIQPDAIVTQTLCDICAVAEIEVTAAAKTLPHQPQVINLSPMSLGDVLDELMQLGRLLGCEQQAAIAVHSLKSRIDTVKSHSELMSHQPTVVLLEWIDPPFSAGHWSPELVRLAGGSELIGREGMKSRRIDWQVVLDADPELLVVACCGFNVERSLEDVSLLRNYPGFGLLRCFKENRVFVADGSSYFNRPGPRLVDSLELLAHAINPTDHPLCAGSQPLYHVTF